MRRFLLALVVAALPASLAWGICVLPPPRDDPPPPPPTPAPPSPPDTGTPTPGETPGPITPGDRRRRAARTGRRASGADYSGAWYLWWELHREHLLGLRQTAERRKVVSGGEDGRSAERARLAREEARRTVREALRQVAARAKESDLRAAALRALGRAGNEEDARTFLALLRRGDQPTEVLEGAAIGLGCLPHIEDEALQSEVLDLFGNLLRGRSALSKRVRRLAILGLGVRAQEDRALARRLALHCESAAPGSAEAATILYGCGLSGDPLLVPLLLESAATGKLGGRKLGEVARASAVTGLALSAEPRAIPALAKLLRSRSVRVQIRRSAALAIGMLARSASRDAKAARQALLAGLDGDRDPLVQGYCAVGLGTASEPGGIDELRALVDRKGDPIVRPFAALALGLAAPRLPEKQARGVRRFLHEECARCREFQLAAALSIAVGLAGAHEARDELLARLEAKRLYAAVRGPAIQGLGLLRASDPKTMRSLILALEEGSDPVVEDAGLALGLIGGHGAARLLVDKLASTKSERVQKHLVAALSHLGGSVAIGPLLELLDDESRKHTVRQSAAVALGILVDDRDVDPLFRVDAHCNPYALTPAARTLVAVY
jgi:HEAT repeat protein